ncbi:hypothetical protein U1Q18_041000 [Sarracenia purpurea var. burkii]
MNVVALDHKNKIASDNINMWHTKFTPENDSRGSRRTEQGILRKELKREPFEGFQSAIAMGVLPAFVDDHGGHKRHQVEDDEEGDDPSILSPLREVCEEGHFWFFRQFIDGGIDGDGGW